MTPRLTEEQREAIRQSDSVMVEDDETQRVYFIINSDLYDRAMQALEELDARRAIRAGIDDLEAGRFVPFADVDARLGNKLGLAPRTA